MGVVVPRRSTVETYMSFKGDSRTVEMKNKMSNIDPNEITFNNTLTQQRSIQYDSHVSQYVCRTEKNTFDIITKGLVCKFQFNFHFSVLLIFFI